MIGRCWMVDDGKQKNINGRLWMVMGKGDLGTEGEGASGSMEAQ